MEPTQKEIAEAYQPLFNLLYEEYGLTMLIGEMDEILIEAEKVNNNLDKLCKHCKSKK